jgi:hypothetical protein
LPSRASCPRFEASKEEEIMARTRSAAAKRNIKKAAGAAKRRKTISRLPAKTRTALGKEGAKAAKRKRSRKSR